MEFYLSSSIDGPGPLVMISPEESLVCWLVSQCGVKWYHAETAKWETKAYCPWLTLCRARHFCTAPEVLTYERLNL